MQSRGKVVPEECGKAGSQFEINEKIAEQEIGSGNTKSVFHRLP